MERPFDSSHRKLARAKEHLRQLALEIERFNREEPYTEVVEPHPDNPGILLHKVKLVKPFPPDFLNIAGDAAGALRAALDQACYAVAVASGKSNPTNSAFPFADTEARLENQIKGRSNDLPSEIKTLLREFKPYKGGNSFIWALNAICNADKHTTKLRLGTDFDRPFTGIRGMGYFKMTLPEHSVWDSANQEIVLFERAADATFNYDFQFVFFVAFDKIEVVERQPVLAVFDAVGREVKRIVLAIEAESRRLGLVK